MHFTIRRSPSQVPRAVYRVTLAGLALLLGTACSDGSSTEPLRLGASEQALLGELPMHWVGTWGASPLASDQFFFAPPETFEDQTLRQVAHVSIGGVRVRVRISNRFGAAPLAIGAAHVARHSEGASILPWTDRTLTFGGQASVAIPAGEEVLSDPTGLVVPPKSDLAITLYLPESSGLATWHEIGRQTTYVSPPGDFTGAVDLPVASTTEARYFTTGVDVHTLASDFSIVTFGDSITDGFGSTVDANRRYPDYLSERLNTSLLRRVGVLNQGLSGNRALFDFLGESAGERFDRDVLSQAGVRYVVLLLGINDIGFPGAIPSLPPEQTVPAADIIAGIDALVARAHAAGLTVYGGTLTPFEGATLPGYFSLDGEAKRQAVNDWVRSCSAFDAVFDFDAVLRDPAHPTSLLPLFDSGDHIHPSDAGYEAMADSIDLSLFP